MSPVRADQLPGPLRARLTTEGVLPTSGKGGKEVLVAGQSLGEGPWISAYTLSVLGPLRSKSNRRRYNASEAERASWRADKDFSAALAQAARTYQPPTWDLGEKKIPLPRRPVVVMAITARGKVDAANLTKSIPDAFEGIAYHNDASVLAISAISCRTGMRSGVRALALLEPGASQADQLAALNALTVEAVRLNDSIYVSTSRSIKPHE